MNKLIYFLVFLNIQNAFTKLPICISLGDSCSTAMMLRYLKIRTEAYHFDWIISPFESLYNALQDGFKFFLTDLKMKSNKQGVIDYYGFHFVHDFPTLHDPNINALKVDFVDNCILFDSWEKALPLVKVKYLRRITRFKEICSGSEKVIFIRWGLSKEEAILLKDFF